MKYHTHTHEHAHLICQQKLVSFVVLHMGLSLFPYLSHLFILNQKVHNLDKLRQKCLQAEMSTGSCMPINVFNIAYRASNKFVYLITFHNTSTNIPLGKNTVCLSHFLKIFLDLPGSIGHLLV